MLHGYDYNGPQDELSGTATILRKFENHDAENAGFMVFKWFAIFETRYFSGLHRDGRTTSVIAIPSKN